MKYHPKSDTIVPPFNEHKFLEGELFDLVVEPMPPMKGGDTVLAKPPVRDGDIYRMSYCLLVKDSPAYIIYLTTRDVAQALALVESK